MDAARDEGRGRSADGRLARLVCAWALLLGVACGGGQPARPGDDLIGTWRAVMERDGAQGELEVRFERRPEGDLAAVLSLPTIDAWDAATLPVRIDGDRVDLALFALHRDTAGGLSGVLPPALVPVHQIPFTLRRTDAAERPAPAVVEAPEAEAEWVVELGSPVWAGVGLAAGTLYVGADDGVVRALDAASGRRLWERATGGAIRAPPTPEGGDLLVHSDDGYLYALEPATGAVRWRSRIEAAAVERLPLAAAESRYDHAASAPVRAGDAIFVGDHDGGLVAVDAATGARRWRFRAADVVSATPAVADGRVVFGSFDGRVYALDAADGSELWRHDAGGAVPTAAAVAGGRAIVGSRSYELLALDLATGAVAWSRYLWYSWVDSSPTVFDGTVYVGSSDAQALSALDAATGTPRWRFDLGGSGWGQPAVTTDAVYLGAVGVAGYMVDHRGGFFAVDRASGEARWQVRHPRPGDAHVWGVAASPACDGHRVFVADLAGRVAAYRASAD